MRAPRDTVETQRARPLPGRTGTLDNQWLFTGEQYEGGAGGTAIEPLALDDVLTATNLAGATVANLDEDPDDPDGDWATATTVDDTELRAGFPTPAEPPVTGADLQEFRVLVRKDASGGVDPTVDLELWETGGGSALATLASGVTVSSETGQIVSGTWDASLLATADGSAVELRVVGHASTDAGNERAVELGAVEWNAAAAVAGADLYFLRARYYDFGTGRFISRDVVELSQRYAYGYNNPVLYMDPNGEFGLPKISCDVCGRAARAAQSGVSGAVTDFARSNAGQVAIIFLDAYALGANATADALLVASPAFAVSGCVGGLAAGPAGCIAGGAAGFKGAIGTSVTLRGTATLASGASTTLSCLRAAGAQCARGALYSAPTFALKRTVPFVPTVLSELQLMDDLANFSWNSGNTATE